MFGAVSIFLWIDFILEVLLIFKIIFLFSYGVREGLKLYQPSGAGGTHSPAAKPEMATRGPKMAEGIWKGFQFLGAPVKRRLRQRRIPA